MNETIPHFSVDGYSAELRQLLFDYSLQLADTSLILGHRVSEWCGHGPILEQDIALSNIALDLIGETRSFYQYAAALEGRGRTEDDLAYLRDAVEYKNPLLVEQANGDFGQTIMRQFLFDGFHYLLLQHLKSSPDQNLAAIAAKSYKEASYHLKWSSEWVIRLGDGTEESKERMEKALDILWPFTGELFMMTETEKRLQAEGYIPDYAKLKTAWDEHVATVFSEATLEVPQKVWMQKGGKAGIHTEQLGFMLAEFQYLQRTYPGAQW